MQISEIKIRNYKSINSLEIKCDSLFTLLGPNNHGKSNVLSALEFALSTSKKPSVDDLFFHREEGDDELWVELTFSSLTEQEQTTFNRYLLSDGTVSIRKTAIFENGNVEIKYGHLEKSRDPA
ncbi:AAA family ATPase [Rhodovibrio sodomensis]|uniref:AAA family ATPase n=1 Tax=Rhodovibrio sodomensis TaxID=1088 RepID=UPI001F5B46DE|nr:AAA family ATPase [Rhodovibrio sodomensis]